jgi:hypothetical protein
LHRLFRPKEREKRADWRGNGGFEKGRRGEAVCVLDFQFGGVEEGEKMMEVSGKEGTKGLG